MIFENAKGKPVLLAMAKSIQQNKDYLGEVDGLIGDGDHGMNMNKGFTMFADRIADEDIGFSEGLSELGMVLMNEIGGSMGPIYGTIFMSMSDVAEDAETIDAPLFSKMLNTARDELFEIIDARVGDKTLVDTLSPAIDAFDASLAAGEDFSSALEAMKIAAEKGRDSTKDLEAKYGRSSRLGARSIGVLDAGATSCCLLLSAMSDGMRQQIQ